MGDRLAFVDYFPTHYRRRLYEEIARRTDADFFFFADERERYWNRKIPLAEAGDYRRVDLRRYRVGDQAVMPGVAARLLSGRYSAVVKSLNGKLMLPLTYGAAAARSVPFVLWTGMWYHPRTLDHRLSLPLTEALYRRAGAIVTYGEHVRRFVLETPGVAPEKVFVAGQAVDEGPYTAVVRAEPEVPEIVYVGQFEERKGLWYLLDAFDRLDGVPARLRLIGNGSQEGRLRERTRGRDDVEIVGYVAQEDLPGELARARSLVLPSITTKLDREPWGLVVNEAMHAGVPVVATDAVGAAAGRLVRDHRNGFVVPEQDAEGLARAMRRLVTDAELASAMGAAAREDAADFNYGRMADAFCAAAEHARGARRG